MSTGEKVSVWVWFRRITKAVRSYIRRVYWKYIASKRYYVSYKYDYHAIIKQQYRVMDRSLFRDRADGVVDYFGSRELAEALARKLNMDHEASLYPPNTSDQTPRGTDK